MQWTQWSWLYIVCFLDLLGASMIMPVFSSHLRILGISHTDIGMLSSLYGATQLASGPIIGSWSDVNGRQKILCLSLIICSAAYGLLGVVSKFYSFLLIRCILGSFKHTQTLSRAFVADLVPEEKQASVYGLMNAFTSFSFMIGPVIGGHIMDMNNGFHYVTGLVMSIFLLNSAVVYFLGNESGNRKLKSDVERKSVLKKTSLVFQELYNINWKSYWSVFSLKFLFALTGILFFQNMSLILTENFNISHKHMGYTVSFYGFISVLCNLGVERIKHLKLLPKSNLKSLTYTFLVMSITFCVLYFTNSYLVFVLGIVPLSSSHALTRILLTEVLLEESDSSCRGSIVGASSSVAAIARIVTPFLSGVVMSWRGVSNALLVSSVIAIAACLLTVTNNKRIHIKPLKESID